jgi:hypothetical protein
MASNGSYDKPDIVMVDDRDMARDDHEKAPVVHTIDNMRVLGLSEEDAEFYNSYTPEMRKRVIRKVGSPPNS